MADKLAAEEFNFEAEFDLLDIGATSSMLRTGSVRPTVLAFTPEAGVEAVALDWGADGDARRTAGNAFEEARRYARDLKPSAYALIAQFSLRGREPEFHLPGDRPDPGNEFLGVALYAEDGAARGVMYPVRRATEKLSFGMPTVTDASATDWCPLGDIWGNPFCVGDTVRFRHRDHAVDPSTPLWQALVELTRLRMHDDPANSDEYMSFLDELRNGVFVVAGRRPSEPEVVLLRPRTVFNPLGTLAVEASRLLLIDSAAPDVDRVSGGEPAGRPAHAGEKVTAP